MPRPDRTARLGFALGRGGTLWAANCRLTPLGAPRFSLFVLLAAASFVAFGCKSRSEDGPYVCLAKSGDVRFHRQAQTVWIPVAVGMGFKAGTWVQTADDGTAEIRVPPDERMRLEPNTVVILGESSRDEDAQMVKVVVKRGRARIQKPSGRSRTVLPAAKAALLPVKKPPEPPMAPKLAMPENRFRVAQGTPISLQWAPAPEPGTRYELEIAQDAGFTAYVVQKSLGEAKWVFGTDAPGRFYWRVRSVSKDGVRSPFSGVRVFQQIEEFLLSPDDASRVKVPGRSARVKFSWRPKAGALGYDLVLARDPELLERSVVRRSTDAHSLTLKNLRRGTYYWGVFTKKDREALFAKPRKLIIERRGRGMRLPRKLRWR